MYSERDNRKLSKRWNAIENYTTHTYTLVRISCDFHDFNVVIYWQINRFFMLYLIFIWFINISLFASQPNFFFRWIFHGPKLNDENNSNRKKPFCFCNVCVYHSHIWLSIQIHSTMQINHIFSFLFESIKYFALRTLTCPLCGKRYWIEFVMVLEVFFPYRFHSGWKSIYNRNRMIRLRKSILIKNHGICWCSNQRYGFHVWHFSIKCCGIAWCCCVYAKSSDEQGWWWWWWWHICISIGTTLQYGESLLFEDLNWQQ